MKVFFSLIARLFGFNFSFTPKDVIVDQLNESRPLPMGRTEFHEWANRIISGALLPQGIEVEEEVFVDSQKFCLANLIMHLGPTESHKPDAFFIHSLRKFAVNQVADAIRIELRDAAKARTAKDEKNGGQVSHAPEALVQNS